MLLFYLRNKRVYRASLKFSSIYIFTLNYILPSYIINITNQIQQIVVLWHAVSQPNFPALFNKIFLCEFSPEGYKLFIVVSAMKWDSYEDHVTIIVLYKVRKLTFKTFNLLQNRQIRVFNGLLGLGLVMCTTHILLFGSFCNSVKLLSPVF